MPHFHLRITAILFPSLLGATFSLLAIPLVLWPVNIQGQTATWNVEVLRSLGEQDRAHTDIIKNVLVLKDGNRALSCGSDGTLCLWDLNQGKIIRRFADNEFDVVFCMALLNDETKILAAGDGPGVVLWDLETGEKIKQFDHSTTIYSISLFRDNRSFVCGDANGKILQFKIDDEKFLKTWRDESGDITALTVTPDQTGFIAGNDDGEVVAWDLASDEPGKTFEGLTNWTCCLRFSDDGKQLFGSDYSGNVVLWDAVSRKKIWKKETLASDICWGHFVDENTIVAVDTDDAYYLLNRETGKASKKPMVIPAPAGFDLSPDRSTFWSGGNNMVCGWDVVSGKRTFPSDEAMQFVKGIRSLAVTESRVFVATAAPAVLAWDLETGKQLPDLKFQDALKIDWSGLQVIAIDLGIAVCCREGVAVVDEITGEVLHAKKLSNTRIARSPRAGALVFTDRENTRLRELDVLHGTPKTLLEVSKGRVINEFHFLDQNNVAMMVEEYPHRMEIWSIGGSEPIGELERESGFELQAGGQGLLVGKDVEEGIVVFASRRLSKGPLNNDAIERLIQELESDDYNVRESATLALAGGGEQVMNVIQSWKPTSLEMQVRFQQIRQLMASAMLPNLNKPVTSAGVVSETAQSISVDPRGRFFLMAIRDGWKSELLVCPIEEGQWTVATRQPLRSRADKILPVSEKGDAFVVGYVDGTIDVIKVSAGN